MILTLEAARDALAKIDGVATCKIGIEADLSPADYPIVRIVLDRMAPGRPYGNRTATCTIYYGMPIADAEGLEHVYRQLLTMDAAIIREIQVLGGRYLETLMDSDRLPTYKLGAIRCELTG